MKIERFSRALVVVYFLEAGLILTIAPWTRFWERNYLVESWPLTEAVLTSGIVRGSVTGLGIVSLCAVAVELWVLVRRRLLDALRGRGHRGSPRDVVAGELSQEASPAP
jgi:hypothetical protein